MKVLIITNQLPNTCGVSKHLLYFLTETKKRNDIEFTILCGGGDAVDDYKILCKELIIFQEIQHEKRSIINFLKSILLVYKLQLKNKFDIIHSHNHYAANLAQIVGKLTKTKTVQSIHGIIDSVGRLNHYPADYFIAVNEHVKNYLVDNKKKTLSQVKLIRCGIPYRVPRVKEKDNTLKVLAAGRLIEQKGFDTYIKAISKLSNEIKNKVEFILAGKGDFETELIKLATKLNINLNFIGEVKDLMGVMETTNIFVNPSRSSNEGFPITIVEAAFTKNLIISSDFKGYDPILKDNINAQIFHTNNSDELADKLDYAIKNYADSFRISEKSYEDFLFEFDKDKMIKKTISFYEKILR